MNFFHKLLLRRRAAYIAVFGGELTEAKRVILADLRQFCRATVSTTVVSSKSGMVDPIASAQAEGRREVWLRITQHLNLSDADIQRFVNRPDDDASI